MNNALEGDEIAKNEESRDFIRLYYHHKRKKE
jgi:hypothetical protein